MFKSESIAKNFISFFRFLSKSIPKKTILLKKLSPTLPECAKESERVIPL